MKLPLYLMSNFAANASLASLTVWKVAQAIFLSQARASGATLRVLAFATSAKWWVSYEGTAFAMTWTISSRCGIRCIHELLVRIIRNLLQ
jgi:hypothetical protein